MTSSHAVPSNHALALMSLPEELLERILSLTITPPAPPPTTRPSWHPPSRVPLTASSTKQHTLSPHCRYSTLLVSKLLNRISTPLFYQSILVHSPSQATSLALALLSNPTLGRCVKKLIVLGCWNNAAAVVSRCQRMETLDLTIDGRQRGCVVDGCEEFCHSILSLSNIRHLAIRKFHNTYLTQSKPRTIIAHLAKAVSKWEKLETIHIAFRLSDDSPPFAPPSHSHTYRTDDSNIMASIPLNPIRSLALALSTAPNLHTVQTLLPSVWNTILLIISQNPRLERIILGELGEREGIVGTGLFLMEARKWGRLGDVIKCGTPMIRTRAHTLGTLSPTTSSHNLGTPSVSTAASSVCSQTLTMTEPIIQRPWET